MRSRKNMTFSGSLKQKVWNVKWLYILLWSCLRIRYLPPKKSKSVMPDILCFQIEDLKVTVGYLASKLLSKEEKSGLRFEKLIVAAQSNLLDRSVQISELLDINDSLSGELKVLSSLDHNFTSNFFICSVVCCGLATLLACWCFADHCGFS